MSNDLISALRGVLLAAAEEEAAKAKSEGANWSYFGFQFVESRRKAEEAFTAALEAVIDERVKAALAAREA